MPLSRSATLIFPLAKIIVYHLMDLGEKEFPRLKQDSYLRADKTRKRLRDMERDEVHAAVAALKARSKTAAWAVWREGNSLPADTRASELRRGRLSAAFHRFV